MLIIKYLYPKMENITPLEMEVINEASWEAIMGRLLDLSEGRRIWLLEGDLGSGKTTLARYLIHYLGGEDEVSSPTFSLVNDYDWVSDGQEYRLYHLDLYRLESVEEVIDIGFEEIIDSGDFVVIEWPEVAEPLLPDDCFRLKISHFESHRKVLVL